MIIFDELQKPLKHGGDLAAAHQKYDIGELRWLDMSTGISPWAPPIPCLSEQVWRELPPKSDELLAAAAVYYQVPQQTIYATPGSQLPIRLIPQILAKGRVAIPELGYQEHDRSWQLAGHSVLKYQDQTQLAELINSKQVSHAVVINPNNPSGEVMERELLIELAQKLDGLMVVDEAFMDVFTQHDRNILGASNNPPDNVLVLRSLGKFFGLGGLRIGFLLGQNEIASNINAFLQPWAISHASIVIATQVLRDFDWQQKQSERIWQIANEFEQVLNALSARLLGKSIVKNTGLFLTVFGGAEGISELHHKLAWQGIWTRLHNAGDSKAWSRFSLPNDLAEFEKRITAL